MRLLHAGDGGPLTLKTFEPDSVPPYAILSHTWLAQDDEVSYIDIVEASGTQKPGYGKLQFCHDQAQKDGLQYFWVDTCCIQKSDSSELSEAINSMFAWYEGAAKCYVYLSDVSIEGHLSSTENNGTVAAGTDTHSATSSQTWLTDFSNSRYWSRGWTLQELLAPKQVDFYSKERQFLGDKRALQRQISRITEIPGIALTGSPLRAFGIQDRFRWAARRNTKKAEDHAYCLLGIFGVSMPLIYGEGKPAAMRRLKDAVADALRLELHMTENFTASFQDNADSGSYGDADDSSSSLEKSLRYRQKLALDSLKFEGMNSRREAIRNAHGHTCDWILTHSMTVAWNDPGRHADNHGLLWINGKPGTGKSTLMKYHAQRAKTQAGQDEIVLSFFFNARSAAELEKTTVGLYRSFLYQLCSKVEPLCKVLVQNLGVETSVADENFRPPEWTLNTLCVALSAVVGKLGKRRLRCFIDALDETSEDDVRALIEHFDLLVTKALESGSRMLVCFSSRHYPAINVRYGQRLILENEDGHSRDMDEYVNARLQAGDSTRAEELKPRLKKKANGVFMWIVLVIEILNKEFLQGRIFAVEKRLEELPAELGDLFRDMMKRDGDNMEDLRLCLQWLLFARRPLKRTEFYFAMLSGLQASTELLPKWESDKATTADMNKFVLSCSKGLAELTASQTVQFIHESVRDFLLKDNGLATLWPDLVNASSVSHERLKACCHNYLSANAARPRILVDCTAAEWKTNLPFLEYAVSNVFQHAEQAAATIPQNDFLANFDFFDWSNPAMLLKSRLSGSRTMLDVLAACNCPRLIRALPYRRPIVIWCGTGPMSTAVENGHLDVLGALVGLADNEQGRKSLSIVECGFYGWCGAKTSLLWAMENGYEDIANIIVRGMTAHTFSRGSRELLAEAEASDSAGRTVLSFACEKGFDIVRNWVLSRRVQIDIRDNSGLTPLAYAANHGRTETVRLLIHREAEIDSRDGDLLSTPLISASTNGHDSVVEVLLSARADIEARNARGSTALMQAAEAGQDVVVRTLLRHRAWIEATNDLDETALHRAAMANQSNVVEILLDAGACIDSTCGVLRMTALQLAARAGHHTVVSTLLARGANVHATSLLGKTALYEAALKNHHGVSELLLKYGADIDGADRSGQTVLHWQVPPTDSNSTTKDFPPGTATSTPRQTLKVVPVQGYQVASIRNSGLRTPSPSAAAMLRSRRLQQR